MRVWVNAVLCCLMSAVLTVRVSAQTPLTPGEAALLVTPVTASDVTLLAKAVADPDARVRTLAARAAGILNRNDLAPALLEMASRETDARAVAEQLRALLFLRGESAIADVKPVAVRMGGPALLTFAEWLARAAPQHLVTNLADLSKVDPDNHPELAGIVAMAVKQTPTSRDAITQRWINVAKPDGWRAYLDSLWDSEHRHATPIKEGLSWKVQEIREATLWFSVASAAEIDARGSELTDSVTAPDQQLSEWGELAREVLARRFAKRPARDRSSTLRQLAASHRGDALQLAKLGELTSSERAVLRASLGDEVPKSLPDRRQLSPDCRRSVTARNFEHIAPGLLTSLADKVGCMLPAQYEVYTGARIAYQPDGRPQDIGIDASKVTEACGKAVRVTAFLSLAQRNEPVVAGRTVWVFLPHMKSLAACIDEADAPAVKIDPEKGIKRPER